MGIPYYLAMTGAEMAHAEVFPRHSGWMACHFSPYGTGLSNLPRELPPGSLLIVDDITPPHSHDPVLMAEQLSLCAETWHCSGLLLDFQRPGCVETAAIAKHLASALPCPTAVSAAYAGDLDCAVCLPPVPPSQPLEAYLSPWSGRETWLELALDGESITLTEQGAATVPLPCPQLSQPGFRDDCLHCHYRIHLTDDRAEFTLWRTEEDLAALMEAAENLGVMAAVGLYQELWNWSRRVLCPQPAANQGTAPS